MEVKRKRKESGPKEDLTGKRFGSLVVTSIAGKKEYPSGDYKYIWNCKCDCGNETTPTGNALKTGNTRSCRVCAYVSKDIVGQSFSKLTVISRAEDFIDGSGKKVISWNCRCSCGNSHVASSGNLVNGNVKSCGCLFYDVQANDLIKRKDDFITKANKIHNSKYEYDLSSFENTDSVLNIKCPVHGIFLQKVKEHIFGCGCQKCSSESRMLGNEEFIRRSSIVHNNKYDYSLVDYVKNSVKVKIICPIHGVFEQSPASHVKGHQCFDCAADARHWNYKHYCESNPEFAERDGCIYLVKLTHEDESFLKVGVSVNLGNRFAKYRQDGLDVEPLYVINTSAEDSSRKEIDILNHIKTTEKHYVPTVKFAGRTECANEDFEYDLVEYFRRLDVG